MTLRERLTQIQQRKAEGFDAMNAMLDKALEESRDMNDQEEAEYAYLDAECEKLKKEESRVSKLLNDEEGLTRPQGAVRTYIAQQNTEPDEFRTFGEFLWACRFNQVDQRLQFTEMDPERVRNMPPEQRAQSMGIGAEGGFAVPTQFLPQLRMIEPQQAIFRPRCTVIPAGDPPDSMVSMPVLDQTAGENMYGGMQVQWIEEAGEKPETDLALRQVNMTPHEVAGHVVVTDKLLRNWGSADAVITNMLRLCLRGTEDTVFLNGTGVGRPLGITNAPAAITVARTTANQVAFADVHGMFARTKFGGSLLWIASQTIIPQLVTMVDAGTNSVWLGGGGYPSAAAAPPGTLLGIPLMFNDRSPALGTTGDLILVDLSYYLIKDGSGPFVATSPHVHFTSNRTIIKIFWNVDGQPWLSAPIPLEGSAANTVSPFVLLG